MKYSYLEYILFLRYVRRLNLKIPTFKREGTRYRIIFLLYLDEMFS